MKRSRRVLTSFTSISTTATRLSPTLSELTHMRNRIESLLMRHQISVSAMMIWTALIALAVFVSSRYSHGLFGPLLVMFATGGKCLFATNMQSRARAARFFLGAMLYSIFVPGLDFYLDQVVWRIVAPEVRRTGGWYDLVELAAIFLPLILHGLTAFLLGWLAAFSSRNFLFVWLLTISAWLIYPLLQYRNVIIDPLFENTNSQWPSDLVCVVALSSVANLVWLLELLQIKKNSSSQNAAGKPLAGFVIACLITISTSGLL